MIWENSSKDTKIDSGPKLTQEEGKSEQTITSKEDESVVKKSFHQRNSQSQKD